MLLHQAKSSAARTAASESESRTVAVLSTSNAVRLYAAMPTLRWRTSNRWLCRLQAGTALEVTARTPGALAASVLLTATTTITPRASQT
jgi:hypothetical protein